MHASVQSGGRSPKPLNSSTSNHQKIGTENVQKNKKRERGGEQGAEPTKRERYAKSVDGESISSKLEIMMKAEFSKITDKGVLVTTESVDNLVHVMQLDKNERKIDLAGRLLVANVITATDRIECLVRFVQLKGVPVFDDWLQEAHNKGKSDGSSPKEIDKGAEELLLALLRALDKLPINLHALQTCNIGKSVNHLRSHKNPEIQKKARSLVDTWKKRVDAEMALFNDGKPGCSEAPHAGGRHIKNSITHTPSSACKILINKPDHADDIIKSASVTTGSLKLSSVLPTSVSISSKDSPVKGTATSGNSELPLASGKDEKSTGSSQSLNNSQSSWKEDAKSSTSGSMNANKSCRHRRSSNGFSDNNQEGNLVKAGKVSCHNVDMTSSDQGNSHRLIVRLPNPGKSPACKANGDSVEENSILDKFDQKIKTHGDALRSNTTDVNAKLCQSSGLAAIIDEESRTADETGKYAYSSSGNGKGVSVTKSKSKSKCLFSSMNVLVERCPNYSEASTSSSAGDDTGINLLANVAAGEISTSSTSPKISPKMEFCAANIDSKSKILCDSDMALKHVHSDEIADLGDMALNHVHSDEVADFGCTKQDTFDKLHETSKHLSVGNGTSCQTAEKSVNHEVEPEDRVDRYPFVCIHVDVKEKSEGDKTNYTAVDDKKPIEHKCENIAEADTKALGKTVTGSSAATVDSKLSCGVESQNETVDIKLKILISEIAEAHMVKNHDELDDNNLDPSGKANEGQIVSFQSNTMLVSEISGKKGIEVSLFSDVGKPSSIAPTQESDAFAQNCVSEVKEEVKSMKADKGVKCDFDLNEGFSVDDCNQSEQIVTSGTHVCATVTPFAGMSPLIPSIPNGLHAHITVASPAKGSFIPPENLIRNKGEHGWKGSAATSAFRPAEPRKVLEMPLTVSSLDVEKQGRPPLEIDLNIADEMVLEEEMAPQGSTQTAGSESGITVKSTGGGLELDLNKADESTDNGQFLADSSNRVQVPFMPVKPSNSRSFPANDSNMLGGFDLNNGPGLDEVGTELNAQKNQYAKKSSSNLGFVSQIGGIRMGDSDMGNVPSWFPSGNTYPTVAMPSFLPGDNIRVEHQQPFSIVAAQHGNQRTLGSVIAPNTFGGDIYKGGPVLSSSPAMPYPPSTAFPYASFPFGSTFPLTSTSFSTGTAPHYVDSACFQPIPSQLVGPTGTIFSHYARSPYMVSLPEGSSSSVSERNRKWGGGQGLDLNAGPGSIATDVDVKGDRRPRQPFPIGSSQAFVEEQARLYQMSGGGMKRKDREGSSWDDRYNKQPSWQ